METEKGAFRRWRSKMKECLSPLHQTTETDCLVGVEQALGY